MLYFDAYSFLRSRFVYYQLGLLKRSKEKNVRFVLFFIFVDVDSGCGFVLDHWPPVRLFHVLQVTCIILCIDYRIFVFLVHI